MKKLLAVKKITAFIVFVAMLMLTVNIQTKAATSNVKLGDDLLLTKYQQWIDGKKIGLVTNQTGVNSIGQNMVQVLAQYQKAKLAALYTPEHGLDGKATAGSYVKSYMHPVLKIPVYSLYGDTRMPTEDMLKDVDVLLFDIQDIGARSYTYISTLQYCMVAAEKYKKELIVLDRPNPLGGVIVDGPVLKDGYQSFVGVDTLPMAHGMTVGELAQYFNRKIGVNLRVVPMEGYTRTMTYEDTGLSWIQSSPNIPDLQAVKGYMATGMGEGTGIYQADTFQWVGGKGIDSSKFAGFLNQAKLAGVTFLPENRGQDGGVRLRIDNIHSFNPARTGMYVLAYAYQLTHFNVPKNNGKSVPMFNKIMGTDEIGQSLEKGYTPMQIEQQYAASVEQFKVARAPYLIYMNANLVAGGENKARITLQGALQQGTETLIPIKSLLAELKFQIQWDNTAKQLIAANKDTRVVIETEVKPMVVTVNGQYLDTQAAQPRFINNSLYVPSTLVPSLTGAQKAIGMPSVIQWEAGDAYIGFLTSNAPVTIVADQATQAQPTQSAQQPATPAVPKPATTQTPKPAVPVPAAPKPATTKTATPQVNSTEKVAYLTFDDGPSHITPAVLDILKQNNIHATFFLVGKNIKGNEAILKRTVAEGHAIGGHTYSHDYKKIYHDQNAFFADLEAGLKAIEQVTGQRPTMVRFPGGSNNSVSKKAQDSKIYGKNKWIMNDLVEAVTKKGYQYFDWNVSSGDATSITYTASEAIASVKQSSHNKHELVILLHDATGKQNTAKALPEIIRYLKSQGFIFKTLEPTSRPIIFLKPSSSTTNKQATH